MDMFYERRCVRSGRGGERPGGRKYPPGTGDSRGVWSFVVKYKQFPRWATIVALAGMCVVAMAPLWEFISLEFWPQQFEVGYHHIPMRDYPEWIARWQTIGWDHSWFNGHPTYQFYFPGPAFMWMILDVFLPSHTAYILVSVLPFPALICGSSEFSGESGIHRL